MTWLIISGASILYLIAWRRGVRTWIKDEDAAGGFYVKTIAGFFGVILFTFAFTWFFVIYRTIEISKDSIKVIAPAIKLILIKMFHVNVFDYTAAARMIGGQSRVDRKKRIAR